MNPEKQYKSRLLLTRSLRYLLFAGLLFGAYTEAGFWTTVLLMMLVVENEMKSYLFHSITESVHWLLQITMNLIKNYQEITDENNKEG